MMIMITINGASDNGMLTVLLSIIFNETSIDNSNRITHTNIVNDHPCISLDDSRY